MPNALSVRITGREIATPENTHAQKTDIAPNVIMVLPS